MEINSENSWVSARLATLEPEWSPNAARARAALVARLAVRHHSWTWAAAATAALVVLTALAFPGPRAIAQEFWDRFVLNRAETVRVDLSQLPFTAHVTTNGLEEPVSNVDEAERKAGFRPYLPPPGILPSEPELTVSGPLQVTQTIHVQVLESALAKARAIDVPVPAEWEGVQLHTHIGPIVSASYPGEIRILQGQPMEFSVPSGFPLQQFTEAAFRSIGVSAQEASSLGLRFAAHPFWFLDIPAGKAANIQDLTINGDLAVLIEELNEKGGAVQATVVRSAPERLYAVSSGTRDVSIKIAESLP